MKEFIEKLIERLKAGVDKECVSLVPKIRLCDAIQIVNQLAEEYNQEHDDTDYANIELYGYWSKWHEITDRLENPITNADRIRSMLDTELAEFLNDFDICPHCEYQDVSCGAIDCKEMFLKWLQSEAKE